MDDKSYNSCNIAHIQRTDKARGKDKLEWNYDPIHRLGPTLDLLLIEITTQFPLNFIAIMTQM